ncbi:MAG: M17 family peptidase N-terminal domain-containing protein, partial [Pseudomonadota bacterium]
MTPLANISVVEIVLDDLKTATGKIAIFVEESGKLDQAARRINRLSKGALERLASSQRFADAAAGYVLEMMFPAGPDAEAVLIAKLDRRADAYTARLAGANLAKAAGKGKLVVAAGPHPKAADIGEGIALRNYSFQDQKSDPKPNPLDVTLMVSKPDDVT